MSSSSSPPSAPVDGFGDTLRPEAPQRIAILIQAPRASGYNLNLVLFGVVLANYVQYYRSPYYSKEDRSTKIIVFIVFLFLFWAEACAWVTITRTMYDQDRTVESLALLRTEQITTILLAFVPPTIVQAFLARRTCLFIDDRRAKLVLSVTLAVLITAAVACGLGVFVGACMIFHGRPARFETALLAAYYPIAAVIDVAVSGILAYLLFRRAAGFNKSTDTMLKKLATTALSTASYTAFFAVIAAVLVPTLQNTPYNIVAGVFTDQFNALYTLSLFTTVSLRQELMRQKAANPLGGGKDLSSYKTKAEPKPPSAFHPAKHPPPQPPLPLLKPALTRQRKDTLATETTGSDVDLDGGNVKWLDHDRDITTAATV